jgi:hypothetical protein
MLQSPNHASGQDYGSSSQRRPFVHDYHEFVPVAGSLELVRHVRGTRIPVISHLRQVHRTQLCHAQGLAYRRFEISKGCKLNICYASSLHLTA